MLRAPGLRQPLPVQAAYAAIAAGQVRLSARVLAEFGDAPDRFDDAKARKNGALKRSPGARAYYDALRARGTGHHAALRQLGNRLVGILHGGLKTRAASTTSTAWEHHLKAAA